MKRYLLLIIVLFLGSFLYAEKCRVVDNGEGGVAVIYLIQNTTFDKIQEEIGLKGNSYKDVDKTEISTDRKYRDLWEFSEDGKFFDKAILQKERDECMQTFNDDGVCLYKKIDEKVYPRTELEMTEALREKNIQIELDKIKATNDAEIRTQAESIVDSKIEITK